MIEVLYASDLQYPYRFNALFGYRKLGIFAILWGLFYEYPCVIMNKKIVLNKQMRMVIYDE